MCPVKPDINLECWLAITCQVKIDNLVDIIGHNFSNQQRHSFTSMKIKHFLLASDTNQKFAL